MKIQKSCEHCLHNFGGFCMDKGFGQTVEDGDLGCQNWEISEEYLLQVCDAAPWYLKKPYKSGKLNLQEFLTKLDEDEQGKAVEINLYDAIEEIYKINQQQISEILGVSSDVVGYARAKGTVERRIPHFSKCLYIPEEFFRHFTTDDLPAIPLCYEEYQKINKKPEPLN